RRRREGPRGNRAECTYLHVILDDDTAELRDGPRGALGTDREAEPGIADHRAWADDHARADPHARHDDRAAPDLRALADDRIVGRGISAVEELGERPGGVRMKPPRKLRDVLAVREPRIDEQERASGDRFDRLVDVACREERSEL